MTLLVPNLDDRRFQDIVDEAKRLIPRYCPEWTDHNVSDPGVALIELFAWMTDMLLYRLNQVPDVMYLRFLDLMGITLLPAAPAGVDLTFWLSIPRDEAVVVPAGTEVGTPRTGREESIVFTTEHDLTIAQPNLVAMLTRSSKGVFRDRWADHRAPNTEVDCFPTVTPGDALYLGFDDPLPGGVLELDVRARVKGHGVDPTQPHWVWETWSGSRWTRATVFRDTTKGLNAAGQLVLLLDGEHEPLTVGAVRAHWVRCKMVEPLPGQPAYVDSPKLSRLETRILGATTRANHEQIIPGQTLGRSEGEPGQTFTVKRSPVLPRRPDETVVVDLDGARQEWVEVEHFAKSGHDDRHFTWDSGSGRISFGPAIRHPDGTVRRHGAIPPADAWIRTTGHRVGGGLTGNVAAGALRDIKTPVPFIRGVENLRPARGGVDAESIDNAKRRAPITLRHADRAVTAADFEQIALEASPRVARARCQPPETSADAVRVLIVPHSPAAARNLTVDDLQIDGDLLTQVRGHIDQRRLVGTHFVIDPPDYVGVAVATVVVARRSVRPELVEERVRQALFEFINPLSGGANGDGWPFGRELTTGEIFALLTAIEGVESVRTAQLFTADLRTGTRDGPWPAIPLPEHALPMSYGHSVEAS